MAAQLDTTVKNLDQIVAKRTKEIELQNIQLEQTIEELQQTQDRLVNQEKLASLGALTAGIAHEIKNPLNFINNFADLSIHISQSLQEHVEKIKTLIPSEELTEINELLNNLNLNLDRIYKHGTQADSIVHNMLQHSRGIAGEKMLVDINNLLNEYVTLAYHGMRAQDITFNVKIEKKFDTTLPEIAIVPQEISRVFLNLLNNAYYSVHQKKKQLPKDYIPTIRVSTQKGVDSVIIKIWDNGLGISDDVFPKLFTPFFTTKPPGEGTGLGLSLSYTIITQGHNGTIMADSEPGEFAEFTIELPLKTNLH
jgi:signal transduction histidine kinase